MSSAQKQDICVHHTYIEVTTLLHIYVYMYQFPLQYVDASIILVEVSIHLSF